jgi:cytochrome c1
MNRFSTLTLAIGLAFSAGAMAQAISNDEFKAGRDSIAKAFVADKAACGALSGNAKDICVLEARGKQKIGIAELDASYRPSAKTRYEARVARAEADYAVAKERCDDKAGNAKDVCKEEAKAARITAKADATARMKTSDANTVANEKTAAARNEASDKSVAARQDAVADTMEAQYSVAKEKCDSYAGEAKDYCLGQAKARFGKF